MVRLARMEQRGTNKIKVGTETVNLVFDQERENCQLSPGLISLQK